VNDLNFDLLWTRVRLPPSPPYMKTRIHVNQHIIRSNKKTGNREPVLTVKTYKSNDYCHEALISGPSKVIYSPDKPLPCGAKVWIETESEIICITNKKEKI